jgi:hypothetical protein
MKRKLATLALTGLMVFAFASSSFAAYKVKPNKALSNVQKSDGLTTTQTTTNAATTSYVETKTLDASAGTVTLQNGGVYFLVNGQPETNVWVGDHYFGPDGNLMVATVTSDGYTVDANGVWDPSQPKKTTTAAPATTTTQTVSTVAGDAISTAAVTKIGHYYSGNGETLQITYATAGRVITETKVNSSAVDGDTHIFDRASDGTYRTATGPSGVYGSFSIDATGSTVSIYYSATKATKTYTLAG